MRRTFIALVSAAAIWPLLVQAQTQPTPTTGHPDSAPAEEPSAAALRFYYEYMGGGVALKPLGDRWFTVRFRDVMNAWDSDPLQKPVEGNPILPWKDWDMAWRYKLKASILQASPHRAVVQIIFAKDKNDRSLARLVHLERVGDAWRVDDVTDGPP